MLTRYQPDEHPAQPSPGRRGGRRRKSQKPTYQPAEVGDGSVLGEVVTIGEVMERFGLKSPKNIMIACLTGKVRARKADGEIGTPGGVWLIELQSAQERWG